MTVDSDGSEDRPDWWAENARRREEMDLPPYRPPRFEDGTYTHEIVPKLEDEHDCSIRFASVNPSYPEDWSVEVDGRPVVSIGRHRDEAGNTVYELSAAEFEERIEAALGEESREPS